MLMGINNDPTIGFVFNFLEDSWNHVFFWIKIS
jgi:hypothetical protein